MGKDWRPASCLCCPCPQRSGPDVHRRTTTAVGSGSYMSVKRWRRRMVCVIQAEKGNSDTHHCKGELWTNPDSLRWDARNKLREKAKYSWGLRREAHVEWLFPAEFQAGMQTKLCKSWGSLRPRNAHSNVQGAAGPSHAPVRISRGGVRKGSSLVRAGRAASVTQAALGNPSWQLVGQHFLPFPCPQNIHVIHSMLYQIPIFARITHPMASLTMHAPILTEKHIL